MSNLYSKEIIDHYKNPRNFGELKAKDHSGKAINSVCGDEIYVDLVEKNGKLSKLAFHGNGCAICVGAMSMLSETLADRGVDELSKLSEKEVLDLVGMDPDSPRLKCATLSVEAIRDALGS